MKAKVIVMPKRDVLDPQGKAVGGALHSLGYDQLGEIRVGKMIVLELGAHVGEADARAQVEDMCNKLLANTVIEDYSFVIEE
jgi:phosphoribosylformylglycinamidine synthase PurS subunit